jgi:hypothetical protein
MTSPVHPAKGKTNKQNPSYSVLQAQLQGHGAEIISLITPRLLIFQCVLETAKILCKAQREKANQLWGRKDC